MGKHFAKPGPLYWDWRCLICGDAVKGHWRRQLGGK